MATLLHFLAAPIDSPIMQSHARLHHLTTCGDDNLDMKHSMLHTSVLMRTFTLLGTLNFSGFCKIAQTVFKMPKLLSIVIRNCDKKQLYTSCVGSVEPAGEGVNKKSSSGYALSPEVDKYDILMKD